MAEEDIKSPDHLAPRAKPMTSVRLNRKATFIAIGALSAILLTIVWNVSEKRDQKTKAGKQQEIESALGAARDITRSQPGISTAQTLPTLPPLPMPAKPLDQQMPSTIVAAPGQAAPAAAGTPQENPADVARLAETAAPNFKKTGVNAVALPGATGAGAVPAALGQALDQLGQRGGDGTQERDINQQAEKQAFGDKLASSEDTGYLDSRIKPQISPYELKTGSVIPGVMIGTITSDLPGAIVGQVSQNVYDSATGNHLLIPQGTRLFGRYDSNVTFGQERLLVGWQRLIFPNGSTLEIKGMNGHDMEGSAGFADEVNNHYGRIFGWGLITSLLSAGFQLSQPKQSVSDLGVVAPASNGQVVAGAVGTQLSQIGIQMAQRNMQVQPTITIRKGYQFNVMVSKDILFPGVYAN